MAKVLATAQTGSHEQVSVEIELTDPKNWDAEVLPYLQHLDARIGERNGRILAMNTAVRKLTPDLQNIIHGIFDVLFGRVPHTVSVVGDYTEPTLLPSEANSPGGHPAGNGR